MRTGSVLLVGMDLPRVSVAAEAARSVFPGASVTAYATLDEALKSEQEAGLAVVVLSEAADADVPRAAQALDASGLPRWAVVVLRGSGPDDDAEAVAPEDWTAPRVGRVLRSSAERHRLRRENASLRGDLLTLGLRVAHDLRTPLGCISVATETLKDAFPGSAPGERALIKSIADCSEELAGLIRQVSLLEKATARPVPRHHVDMGAVVWAARERLRPALQSSGASVTEPASWPGVVGDGLSLEEVWWNLVSNALRHSGKKPRIELGWEEEPEAYRFWVRDHGPGVPPRVRGLLFQPFNQLHEPNAMRGLGLSIVQRLVELQGGRCGYDPLPSGGSRFFFTLPRASADGSPAAS